MPAKKTTIETPAIAAVPLPSADLIIYRFDQTDKKFEELNSKLDMLTNSFMTVEQAHQFKEDHDKDIADVWKKFDEQRWYWRALIVAVLGAMGSAFVALMTN